MYTYKTWINGGSTRKAVRTAIRRTLSDGINRRALVDASKHRHIFSYADQNHSGAAFGEDFLCWLVTDAHMHPAHALVNRQMPHSRSTAGYDFIFDGIKVEVKTKGSTGALGEFTRHQLRIADIFIIFNLSGRPYPYKGDIIPNNYIYIIKNKGRVSDP